MERYLVGDSDLYEMDTLIVSEDIIEYKFSGKSKSEYKLYLDNSIDNFIFKSGKRKINLDYGELHRLILLAKFLDKDLGVDKIYKEVTDEIL